MAGEYFPDCKLIDDAGYIDFAWQTYFREEQGTLGNAAIGPASAINGNVAVFSGTDGKTIVDGGTLGTAAFTPASAYDVAGAASAAVVAHVALPDPHIQYQNEAEKDAASGYAGLDANSRVTNGVKAADDLIIDLATKGLVLKDTAGTPHYWRVTIDQTIPTLVLTDLGAVSP